LFWPHRTDPRLYATAGRLAATVNGPGGALYDGTWFEGGVGRVTAFVPVQARPPMLDERATGEPDVRWFSVPGQRLAVARHCGPFADLDRTYGTLGRHVLERGLCAEGPIARSTSSLPPTPMTLRDCGATSAGPSSKAPRLTLTLTSNPDPKEN
jgi:hypothetical protein